MAGDKVSSPLNPALITSNPAKDRILCIEFGAVDKPVMVSLKQINADPDRYRVVESEIENTEHFISEVMSRLRGLEREKANLEFQIEKLGDSDDEAKKYRLRALPAQIHRDQVIVASYARELATLRALRVHTST